MPLLAVQNLMSTRVTDDPIATLWHYLCGHMLDWAEAPGGLLAWRRSTHRGVQWLDNIQFPRHQKRYIFSPDFEIRHDTAFEQTIRGCANQPRKDPTWISEEYILAMIDLFEMGYAHSFEAWQNGHLVGGMFGVQLGSMMSCDSMFHTVSNASKACYGQMLVHLRQRGFRLVDTNGVAKHQVKYGEEWIPQWWFEKLIFECLEESPTLDDDAPPPPPLPRKLRALLPFLRLRRGLARRVLGRAG
jgi:leucyl/phenylalanyl-tRNA--protein transferase